MTASPSRARHGMAWEPRDAVVRLGRSWGWFAFFGVVSLVAGILALVWPGHALIVLATVFGAWLVISGVFSLVAAIAYQDSVGTRVFRAILGLLGLLVGLYALRHVLLTVVALGLVLGIYWIIAGITELFTAIERPGLPARMWVAIAGVLGILAGVAMLVWPGLSVTLLALLVGIWLLCYGVLYLVIAATTYRLSRLLPEGRQ